MPHCNGVEYFVKNGSCPDCDLSDIVCHSPFRGQCNLDSGKIYKRERITSQEVKSKGNEK